MDPAGQDLRTRRPPITTWRTPHTIGHTRSVRPRSASSRAGPGSSAEDDRLANFAKLATEALASGVYLSSRRTP
jgi:hypothetical protein